MELAQPWQQSVDGEAFGLRSEGAGDDPIHRRSDRRHGEHQRQGHPAQAMEDQRRQAAPPPQHGGEEPAQQEEGRHAESVHGKEQLLPRAVIAGRPVLHRPYSREERQRRVQPDAEQHSEGAKGVQLVAARLAARLHLLLRFGHRERLPGRAVGFLSRSRRRLRVRGRAVRLVCLQHRPVAVRVGGDHLLVQVDTQPGAFRQRVA